VNWKTKVASTIVALSIIVPSAAFAANEVKENTKVFSKSGIVHQRMDETQRQDMQEQLMEMVKKYAPGTVTEWESALAKQQELMSQFKDKLPAVSDEMKEKMQNIGEQFKNGDLTKEQVQEKMKELGIERPMKDGDRGQDPGEMKERPMKDGDREQVSDEVKEKIKVIQEQLKNGDLTQEQAREELKALGIERHIKFGPVGEISDEIKDKIKSIQEQVENGDLTQEQAREELKALGIEKMEGKLGTHLNLMIQFKEAVSENDAAKITELLPQLLEQLQEQNEKMSERASK